MNVHFTPELQARIEAVAAEANSGTDEYVQMLVESYIEHDVWFRQTVGNSLDRLDRGEFVEHSEVADRIETILRRP